MTTADVLSTQRLLLEPWHEGIREQWSSLYGDPRVTASLGNGRPFTQGEIEDEFDWMTAHWEEHGFGWRSVIEKTSGKWLGVVGLSYLAENAAGLPPEDIEIGWWLKPEYWGRGIASEGAAATRDEGFADGITEHIWARHNSANPASGRIMQKIGMTFVRDGRGVEGVPIRIYEMTRERWMALAPNNM